jgi:biotin transport system permease protein
MTLTYQPGDGVAYDLDPRSKLAFQAGFALAAFGWTHPAAPLALTVVASVALAAARLPPVAALREYRLALLLLAGSVAVEAVRLGPPWLDPTGAWAAAVAAYRVALVLAVSAAYVRSTPVADTRAALQWLLPGRTGRVLAASVGFVLRLLPALQADLRRVRDAARARLGDQRPLQDRMATVAVGGLRRALARADRLALALQARCFAWNPTLPPLRFGTRDVPVVGAGVVLALLPLL